MSRIVTLKAFSLSGFSFPGGTATVPASAVTHVGVRVSDLAVVMTDGSVNVDRTVIWLATVTANATDITLVVEHDPLIQIELGELEQDFGADPDVLPDTLLSGSERVAIKQEGSWFRTTISNILSFVRAQGIPWGSVTAKPDTFPPDTHTHSTAQVTGLQGALAGKLSANQPTLDIVDHNPSNPDSRKLRAIADQDGWTTLEAAHGSTPRLKLSADELSLPGAEYVQVGSSTLQTMLDAKAATSHTHAITDVTGLQTALDSKGTSNLAIGTTASTAKAGDWVPTWSDVTGKPSTFTPATHTHTASQISDSTAVGRSVLTAASQAAARTAIGAGTSSLTLGTTASTAKAGDYTPSSAEIEASLGYIPAPLNANGQVPAENLPSYVDDVVEAANLAAFPGTGEVGKVYVALDTNRVYRWTGSIYLWINSSVASADTADTLSTPRTINGTSFNGAANITTALWGTARNITIGSSTKSVNGSANISWTLAEIGAAAASHTHTAGQISDSSAVGRSLLTAADAAAAREAIGAGTGNSNLAIGTTATTAKAGNWVPAWGEVTDKPSAFAPAAHTHTTADVSGLQAALDTKVSATGSVPVVIDTSSTSAALRITQTGPGEALRVEDSESPDTSPFVVRGDGYVGIGTRSPSYPLHVVGTTYGVGTGSVATLLDSNSDTPSGPQLWLRKSRGTFAAPTAVQANDILGGLNIHARDATTYRPAGEIGFAVSAYNGENDLSALAYIRTRPVGVGSTPQTRWVLNPSGNIAHIVNWQSGTTGSQSAHITTATVPTGVEMTEVLISTAAAGTFGGTSANVYGFVAASTIGGKGTGRSAGFVGNLAAGTGNWNLYMSGTAPNYFAGACTLNAGGTTPTAASDSNDTTIANTAFVRSRIAEAVFASGSTPTWQEVWSGASTSVAGASLTGGALAGVYRVVSADDYEGASGVVSIGGAVENTTTLSVSTWGVGVLSVLTLLFTCGSFILMRRNLNVGAGTFTDTPKTITAIYRLV